VFLQGGVLFGGEAVDLAGESVFIGIEPRALPASMPIRSWRNRATRKGWGLRLVSSI